MMESNKIRDIIIGFLFGLNIIMFIFITFTINPQIKELTVQCELNKQQIKNLASGMLELRGGIETISYQTDVFTESIMGMKG